MTVAVSPASNPPLRWIDAHCHVQPPYGDGDPGGALDRARSVGVAGFVVVGTDAASSRAAIELAEVHDDVFATVGLHPHDASRLDGEWDHLVALVHHRKVVGVGEAGFDLHYNHSPLAAQEEAFRRHVRLAVQANKALVIHTREAWDETFRVLDEEGVPDRTVFHCFTGGPDEAARCLAIGAHLSFSGIVSFKAADDLRAAARICPPDRLMIETDSPYLAPVPHRGRPNEPAYVVDVAAAVADATGRDLATVARQTVAVTKQVFGLPTAH